MMASMPSYDAIHDDTARNPADDAGLHILQVAHQSPPWANPNPSRFPTDLRDAYTFYRDMAKRWKGEVDAFEPWNEADFTHAGFEMSSMQKASYLGLKSGNPDVIVCMNVFAFDHAATLADVATNDTAPYFDRYNFHHYIWLDQYPAFYTAPSPSASMASRCGSGRIQHACVQWSGDPKLQEPDEKASASAGAKLLVPEEVYADCG